MGRGVCGPVAGSSLTAAAIATCLVAGCGRGVGSDDEAEIPPGVTVFESAAPAWTAADRLRLAGRPRVSIGGGAGDEAELYRVSGALRMSDGRITIANSGSGQIRFYAADGAFQRAVGGEGDGPGEFRFLLRLVRVAGDTLIAWDAGSGGRLSRFSPEGEFLGSLELERMGEDGVTQYLGTFSDGMHVGQATDFPDPSTFADGGVVEMGDDTYWLFGADGQAIRRLVTVPQAPRFVRTFVDGTDRGATLSTLPFRRGWLVALAPDGLRVAVTERFEVREVDREGTLRRVVRYGSERRRLTGADVDRWVAAGDPDPDTRRSRRTAADAAPLPEYRATAAGLLVGPAGRVWLLQDLPDDMPQMWTVLDADGSWLGEVVMPDGFSALEVGEDYVLGLFRDELDVEHVRLFDLVRGGP